MGSVITRGGTVRPLVTELRKKQKKTGVSLALVSFTFVPFLSLTPTVSHTHTNTHTNKHTLSHLIKVPRHRACEPLQRAGSHTRTYKDSTVGHDVGESVVNVVDAPVIQRAGGVALVESVVGPIYRIGVHDTGRAHHARRLARGRAHDGGRRAVWTPARGRLSRGGGEGRRRVVYVGVVMMMSRRRMPRMTRKEWWVEEEEEREHDPSAFTSECGDEEHI